MRLSKDQLSVPCELPLSITKSALTPIMNSRNSLGRPLTVPDSTTDTTEADTVSVRLISSTDSVPEIIRPSFCSVSDSVSESPLSTSTVISGASLIPTMVIVAV